jgi:carbonic anhydrase
MASKLSRRGFLGCACCAPLAAGLNLGAGALAPARAAGKKTDLTPDQALQLLKDGNRKFVADNPDPAAAIQGRDPRLGRERRLEIAEGQTPFAVLVSCSDSRVPPELLFGRGLGELFIVRNAGNTIDTTALGSLQYAVAELGVPLVLVMGHQRCGAVDAALSVVEKNTTFPGSIGQMLEPIVPAALQAKSAAPANASRNDVVDMAVRENVKRVVTRLRTASEPILLDPLKAGKLKVVGARYSLDDGSVDFFMES